MNSFIVANPSRCIGCRTCEIACALAHSAENALAKGAVDDHFYPRLKVVKTAAVSVPIQCRHCEDAPCANVCPQGAISNYNNTIQIDSKACIGCKTCLLACPFGAIELAPQFEEDRSVWQNGLKLVDADGEHEKEKVVGYKCDLCIGREGGPACVGICPTNAFTVVEGKVMTSSIKKKRQESAKELVQLAAGNYLSRDKR